ncbi:MAG: hypothetical protein KDK28_04550 [Maritimibacter sp.]|nr:hypothetical protein [Maritimibacter sp.]
MTRPSPARLAAFLLAVTAVLAGAALAKGGLYVDAHDGDTLHLLQIVLSEAQGRWPHRDFQTPVGLFATAPIALFVRLGAGVGHAVIYAQILVAVLALPAIWWAALTRFRGAVSYAFGALILVLILALVYGGRSPDLSISMHYNRWAWAAAFVALALAVLPPDDARRAPVIDGLLIGGAVFALALIKVTYVAAFLGPIAVALIARRSMPTLLTAAATGLAGAAGVALVAGPWFWPGYIRDLLVVVGSEVRTKQGVSVIDVANTPENLGPTLVLLAGVILLRQAGRKLEGLLLLLLAPAFLYVTFQNWGNDPKWVWFLGLMLLTLRPTEAARGEAGGGAGQKMLIAAVAALALASPSVINLASSPFRHLAVDTADYVPLLAGNPDGADLQMPRSSALRINAVVALDTPGAPFDAYYDPELRRYSATFRGETFPDCQIEDGYVAWYETLSADLRDSGLVEGKTLFVADILSPFWLYGAGDPLPGGTPWYYAGLPGWDAADYLLVPNCPVSMGVRKLILDAVEAAGTPVTEVRRNAYYVLYAK